MSLCICFEESSCAHTDTVVHILTLNPITVPLDSVPAVNMHMKNNMKSLRAVMKIQSMSASFSYLCLVGYC